MNENSFGLHPNAHLKKDKYRLNEKDPTPFGGRQEALTQVKVSPVG